MLLARKQLYLKISLWGTPTHLVLSGKLVGGSYRYIHRSLFSDKYVMYMHVLQQPDK